MTKQNIISLWVKTRRLFSLKKKKRGLRVFLTTGHIKYPEACVSRNMLEYAEEQVPKMSIRVRRQPSGRDPWVCAHLALGSQGPMDALNGSSILCFYIEVREGAAQSEDTQPDTTSLGSAGGWWGEPRSEEEEAGGPSAALMPWQR